jgi:phosphatidylserine/phosphatidylglycerophosphate/cardiolipin synthase-like enzyme
VLITTANFDYRSFWNNFESGILVHGKEFSQKMIQNFNDELCNSSLITIKQVKEFLTFMVRLKLIIISLYKPLL